MKKYIGIVALALLAVGCNENDNNAFDPNEIRVEAAHPATRATATAFEQGDVMSLYAVEYSGDVVAELQPSGNYINNETMTYDGTQWVAPRTLYWSANPCDFYAIYPYRELISMKEVLFEVATDQSTAESEDALSGYEASDLMWAKAEKKSQSDGAVQMQFRHMLSRLVVKIERGAKFEGEIPEDAVAHIYNTATTAKVDFTIGSLEKYLFSETKTIKMRKIDNETFEAIIVPQFIERSTPLVEITMEGVAYLLNYSMSFRPGYQHTITVTLNTSPDQEKIEISIDGEVGEWE